MKRTGNNIKRIATIVVMLVIGTACSIPVTAMNDKTTRPLVMPIAKSRIMQIVDKMDELVEVNAEIADLLEQEVLAGRWERSLSEMAVNIAKHHRGQAKTAKLLIQEVRKTPHRYEDTDQWEEIRQALVGLAGAHDEATHNTAFPTKLREAVKRCYKIEVDLIELTNPKNQIW
jgi:hypothetical protein